MWCVSALRPNGALDMALPAFVERLGAPIHGYLPYFCNDSSLFSSSRRTAPAWPSLRSSAGYLPPAGLDEGILSFCLPILICMENVSDE